MSYVEIVKGRDGITLKLTPAGREELAEHKTADGWDRGTVCLLADLLEDHLANGWEFLLPEEVGALTAAPILSDNAMRDDSGKLVSVGVGDVYWFPDYAVRSELDELYEKGEVLFPRAEEVA
jgi:hypothetical protein